MVRFFLALLAGVWSGVYAGSLARVLWRRRNYRGAVLAGILCLFTLVGTPVIDIFLRTRTPE